MDVDMHVFPSLSVDFDLQSCMLHVTPNGLDKFCQSVVPGKSCQSTCVEN